MRRLCVLSAIAVLLGSSLPVVADMCTFDDLGGSSIGTVYKGLTWSTEWRHLDGLNYTNNPSGYFPSVVSGSRVAYNRAVADVTVSDDDPFVFNGAYLTGVWRDNLKIDITGSSSVGGTTTILHEVTVVLSSMEATWVGLDWTDVDQVTFHSYGGTPHPEWYMDGANFAMDNFTFNEPLGVVPLPGAILLGVVGLGFSAQRLRRRGA